MAEAYRSISNTQSMYIDANEYFKPLVYLDTPVFQKELSTTRSKSSKMNVKYTCKSTKISRIGSNIIEDLT